MASNQDGPIPGLPGIHLRRGRGVANFLKFIVTHPCSDPWFALLETFAPAALKLGWTLFAPDWEDLLRGQAEAYAKAHGPRPKKGHIPRKQLPLKGPITPYNRSTNLRLTLFLTQPLEKLGWWWLVWNSTDQFFADWHSLLQHVDYCSANPITGPYQAQNNDLGANFNPVHFALPMSTVTNNRAGWNAGPFGISVLPGRYVIILSGSWQRNALLGPLSGCRLGIRIDGIVIGGQNHESEPFTIDISSPGGTVVMARVTILSFNNQISWYSTGIAGVGAVTGGQGSIIVMREVG